MEIDVGDLAMAGNEAGALLSGAGVQLSRADVEELVQRTEGWPVGLYLAALAVKAGAPPAGFAAAARSAAYKGDIPAAHSYARRAARLRPLLTYALPVVSVQALIELARAYISFVDLAGAVVVLEQASNIVQQRPELGTRHCRWQSSS